MGLGVPSAFGTIMVCASLLLAMEGVKCGGDSDSGMPVLLSHHCTQTGDGRPIVVRYSLDHSSRINNMFVPVEADLRREISSIMATRWERVLYLAADDRLTYGEITSVVSDLEKDDPTLHVVLMMKTQVDSHGPVQIKDEAELCI